MIPDLASVKEALANAPGCLAPNIAVSSDERYRAWYDGHAAIVEAARAWVDQMERGEKVSVMDIEATREALKAQRLEPPSPGWKAIFEAARWAVRAHDEGEVVEWCAEHEAASEEPGMCWIYEGAEGCSMVPFLRVPLVSSSPTEQEAQ